MTSTTNTSRTVSVIALCLLSVLGPPWRPAPARTDATPEFGWPLRPRPAVVRAFDNPAHDWLPGHRGVDLAGTPGQPVLSAGPGVVVFAGEVGDRPVVTVAHAGDLRTTYEPVQPTVTVGSLVTRGSPLGTLKPGHPDCPAPACLHWGLLRRNDGYPDPHGRYLNPLPLLHQTPIRLKPLNPTATQTRRTPPHLDPPNTPIPHTHRPSPPLEPLNALAAQTRSRPSDLKPLDAIAAHTPAPLEPRNTVAARTHLTPSRPEPLDVIATRACWVTWRPELVNVGAGQARGWAWSCTARRRATETWV